MKKRVLKALLKARKEKTNNEWDEKLGLVKPKRKRAKKEDK